jgi:hypothetical protein
MFATIQRGNICYSKKEMKAVTILKLSDVCSYAMNHYVSLSLTNRKSSVHQHDLHSPRTALRTFTSCRDQLIDLWTVFLCVSHTEPDEWLVFGASASQPWFHCVPTRNFPLPQLGPAWFHCVPTRNFPLPHLGPAISNKMRLNNTINCDSVRTMQSDEMCVTYLITLSATNTRRDHGKGA